MAARVPSLKHLVELGAEVAGHTLAIVVGFVMMVVGLALGVTMIMLPVGVVVGLLGVLIFLAGIFYRGDRDDLGV